MRGRPAGRRAWLQRQHNRCWRKKDCFAGRRWPGAGQLPTARGCAPTSAARQRRPKRSSAACWRSSGRPPAAIVVLVSRRSRAAAGERAERAKARESQPEFKCRTQADRVGQRKQATLTLLEAVAEKSIDRPSGQFDAPSSGRPRGAALLEKSKGRLPFHISSS